MRDGSAGRARPGVGLAISLLLLGSCAGPAQRPDWISRPDSSYPKTDYLTGLGTGEQLESASSNAVAAISHSFYSRVDQIIVDRQASESGDDGDPRERQSIRIETRLQTGGALEGVRIAESWRDRSGLYYALAVLDKGEARRSLAARLRASEQEIANALAQALPADATLARTRLAATAVAAARERDLLAARYGVVSDDGWRSAPTTADVEERLEQAMGDVLFAVDARLLERDGGRRSALPGLREALAESISEQGFAVDPVDGGNARVRCRVGLSAPFERGDSGWTHYLWQASVELAGPGPGDRALLVRKGSGSASHPDPLLARTIAIEQAGAAMVPALREGLRKLLAGAPATPSTPAPNGSD